MKNKIYTDFSINNILHSQRKKKLHSTNDTNIKEREILNHEFSNDNQNVTFSVMKQRGELRDTNSYLVFDSENEQNITSYNLNSFEDASQLSFLPLFQSYFESSSLWKLQNFVFHYKIDENRYLASPDLMTFKESNLCDDMTEESFNTCKNRSDYVTEEMNELEDEELIDVESIPNCCVTSSIDKVTKEKSPINCSSTLHNIRNELLKLEPPKWTKQQQPKRVYKLEEKYKSTSKSNMVRYTKNQVNILNEHFCINQNPSSNEFHRISRIAGLNHYQVKKWFQNRRAKERKSDQVSKCSLKM